METHCHTVSGWLTQGLHCHSMKKHTVTGRKNTGLRCHRTENTVVVIFKACNFLAPRPGTCEVPGKTHSVKVAPPRFLGNNAKHRCCVVFWQTCWNVFFAQFVKFSTPGHPRSSHQDSEPALKISNRVTFIVVEIKLWNCQDLIYPIPSTICRHISESLHR